STQTSVEHSLYLSGLEYMEVADPDRDAEGEPVLAVGRMLSDGIADPAPTPAPRTDGDPAAGDGESDQDEEEFEWIICAPATRAAASESDGRESTGPRSAADGTTAHRAAPGSAPPPGADEDLTLSEVAASEAWARLRETLSRSTGREFSLAGSRPDETTGGR